jgi:hypothetical protein
MINIHIYTQNFTFIYYNFEFRLTIESEEYKTTFILQKAKRSDSGIYTVTAKNDSGTDKAEVEIVVLSKFKIF